MKIDHVSVGGNDLSRLEGAFAESEMETVYGGPHSSGLTKMSLLGFEDGSYIELISPVDSEAMPSTWAKAIQQNGGPCAWAIGVDDIAAEVARARALGIPASGPLDYSRRRPDGVAVLWKLGFLGDGEPGAVLPFMIKDTTPRSYRVVPTTSVAGSGAVLEGISQVVLGVEDLAQPSSLFRKLYGWEKPTERGDIWEGASLASFPGTPVSLAAPTGNGWLKERLEMFGPSPCAFLIRTKDLRAASERYPLEEVSRWFGEEQLRWVAPLMRNGLMIGVVGR